MLKGRNRTLNAILMASDIVATGGAFLAAYFLRFYSGIIRPPQEIPPFEQYLKVLPFIMIVFPIVFAMNGLYKVRRGRSKIDELFSVFVASSLATLVVFLGLLYQRVYLVEDIAPEWEFSRLVMAVFLVTVISFVAATRFVVRTVMDEMRRRGYNLRRILIAGAGELGRELVDRIVAHEEFGLRAVGFIDDDERKRGSVYQGVRVFGSLKDLKEVIEDTEVDVLFVCLPPEAHHKILHLIDVANKACLEVRVVPDLLQYISLNATVEQFDGLPIINFDMNPMSGYKRMLKRTFDIMLSLIGLTGTAILYPFLALAVKLGNGRGPIFYRQERMGMDGKPFTLLKFRTMRTDAEPHGPVWAPTDDPRATIVGRIMRRTSLDELPQFWNVLMGHMSLVGPRPERPEFVHVFKDKIPNYMLRHKVKAGLTGWAQVNGWRGDTSLEKRIEYDLFYIQNWSLALDLKIIWLTISRSLFGRSPH